MWVGYEWETDMEEQALHIARITDHCPAGAASWTLWE